MPVEYSHFPIRMLVLLAVVAGIAIMLVLVARYHKTSGFKLLVTLVAALALCFSLAFTARISRQPATATVKVPDQSLQRTWERLNAPRIPLDAEKLQAPVEHNSTQTERAVRGTAERAVDSFTRVQQMSDQVATMADSLSEAGRLIGNALVALNQTLDSRNKTDAHDIPPTQEAVTIQFDTQRLERAGLTYDRARETLRGLGLCRGLATSYDSDALRITLHGEFEPDYVPKLKNTVLGFLGRLERPVHLADVADVTHNSKAVTDAVPSVPAPSWVDAPPKSIGNVWRETVATEEYATADECARAADVLLLLKTYDHLSQLLGNPRSDQSLPSLSFDAKRGVIVGDGEIIYEQHGDTGVWHDERIRKLADMGVGIDYIRREIVPSDDSTKGEYYATVERSVGPMKKLYTLLEFTPSVDQELRRRWDELRRQERLVGVGLGAGSVLGLVGFAFGLLKVDAWTKGYYSKRLFLGVPMAIMGTVAVILLLS